nr:inositol 1,4,5-trisphosphate receptor-interacting protein [Misgurnus anguillicaudatus]
MEDTFLNVLFVVVSLLLSKEHKVLQDQNDDVIVAMRDHERVLLQEAAKLENEGAVAMEPPLPNQEASQGPNYKLLGREEDLSDVKQTMANVRTTAPHDEQMSTVGDRNDFRQKAFATDGHEKLHVSITDIDQSESSVDLSHGEEKLEKPNHVQIDTNQADEASFMDVSMYSWYIWKAISLISFLRFLKWILTFNFKTQPKKHSFLNGRNKPTMSNILAKVLNQDEKALTSFCDRVVQVPASNIWWAREFVDGFVSDLLESVRNVNGKSSYVTIEDFIGVGSLYEEWVLRKSIVCDIHVRIVPSKPYSFEFELLRGKTCLYSKAKMVKGTNLSNCLCSGSDLDDDTLCLLHPDPKHDDVVKDYTNGGLCEETSSYLSKTQVVRWFRNAVRKAWEESSHKYDFQLLFDKGESPVSLKVGFRSGKVIRFNITPVVQFQDSQAYLVSYLPSDRHLSDTDWPVCFARYENALLQHFTKTLPDNSCHIRCLQILSFLHKHQIGQTGKCGLTCYHLKNTLLHLLLVNNPTSWQPEQIAWRLHEMLTFLQQRLEVKLLPHALVGNPLVPGDFGFPEEFRKQKPLNLFLPLLSNEELRIQTDNHLVEMVTNIPVLMYEYSR